MNEIESLLESTNQSHVLSFFDELSTDEKLSLSSDIRAIDWILLERVYKEQISPQVASSSQVKSKIDDHLIEPLPQECISGYDVSSSAKLDEYKSLGLYNIGKGRVAALLLAGGQGTRLGVSHPKGMYDVGPPVSKSLFQLQAERILQLQKEAAIATGESKSILWYIMTSEATMQESVSFFELHNYFGLEKCNIIFFEQYTIPSLDFEGKVLMSNKYTIVKSPNGNGGLFEALHKRGVLEHMKANGVEFLHVFSVDNILVKICDPVFVGYSISKGVEVSSKVVEKEIPNEAVGVVCKVKGKIKVVEYCELSDKLANFRDDTTKKLVYNAGAMCDYFFKVAYLEGIAGDSVLPYHIAVKKLGHISMIDGQEVKPDKPNGIKLEKFIFDVIDFTNRYAAWKVSREDEFSPIKNAIGTERDNPETAKKALLRAYQAGALVV